MVKFIVRYCGLIVDEFWYDEFDFNTAKIAYIKLHPWLNPENISLT